MGLGAGFSREPKTRVSALRQASFLILCSSGEGVGQYESKNNQSKRGDQDIPDDTFLAALSGLVGDLTGSLFMSCLVV